jgi:hypothetical protein
MKKRGLSLEEKREHMLQIFYESQDFYLVNCDVRGFVMLTVCNDLFLFFNFYLVNCPVLLCS